MRMSRTALIVSTLGFGALVFAPTAQASAPTAVPAVVQPAPPVPAEPVPVCQYDVYRGVVHVGAVTGSPSGYVSVLVTNRDGSKSVALHGRAVAGNWAHGVWKTYTQRNVKAWLSGHRCEGS